MTMPAIRLGDFIRALPNIKPNLAMRLAENSLRQTGLVEARRAPGAFPAATERCGAYGVWIELHPAGARHILALYTTGTLPLKPRTAPGPIPDSIAAFAAMTDEAIRACEDAQPVTYEVLRDAFWQAAERECPHPPGSPEAMRWREETGFTFRGVRYTREVREMTSNSGKSVVGREITFYGSDGSHYGTEPLAPNRRHDPARNWGLGRE